MCKDVAAVDINMGCPKSFSISGGMGAALLTKPELILDILTTLKRNLDTPVTYKNCNRVSCSSYCCGFRCLSTYIWHPRPCDRSK
ncbi:hypothetical protein ACSBR1_014410 [Camellia fascicularis]